MRSDMNNRLTGAGIALLASVVTTSVVTTFGCAGKSEDNYEDIGKTDGGDDSGANSGADSGAVSGADSSAGSGGSNSGPSTGSNGQSAAGNLNVTLTNGASTTGGDQPCAASDTPTKLQGVVLTFVFDVSASMGNGQFPYFSRELKWDPVVAATKAFFEDPTSKGLSATLTFFPNELAPIASAAMMGPTSMGAECVAADYATPDVPLTVLPSPAFSTAIDAVTPLDADSWRLGTPTLPALEGAIQGVQAMQAADPGTRYVIVLVTDGMPALCPGPDGESVQAVADAAAAVADTIPTYVIGVNNPVTEEEPNPPDTVTDLNTVAVAGGTDAAYIVDTTNPANTAAQLTDIIDTIREFSFTCSLPIPEPTGGEEFDPNEVNVAYTSPSLGDVPFTYDPACTVDNGWHYDDAANPTSIQICTNVCDAIRVQQDEGQLSIELGCVTRIK